MTIFLRLLAERDKGAALLDVCSRQRAEGSPGHPLIFEVAPEAFDAVPGKPFAYWVTDAVRTGFLRGKSALFTAKLGLKTDDDFRFIRSWFEVFHAANRWSPLAKGGTFSPFYSDIHLVLKWQENGWELKTLSTERWGNAGKRIFNEAYYFRPGLTWPRRTNGLSFRVMPAGSIFADKGPAAFVADDDPEELLALSAILNSRAFGLLVSVQLARTELAQSYEVGLIQQTPVPPLPTAIRHLLAAKARRAWSLKRTLDTTTETSHAFLLPTTLRPRLGDFDPPAIEAELARIQAEIDAIAFDLYDFSEADRQAASGQDGAAEADTDEDEAVDDEADGVDQASSMDALLSWAVGVAFGRFDWRLATGEREPPPEPDPFDPLPAKSPGMPPEAAAPFHVHPDILVDDPGHPHDLAHRVEGVLARVDVAAPNDIRRWLQRHFFPFHLQRYSKSRRKAPIYWPLATASGSYSLWVYYPSLSSQTLYTGINDFVEPRLQQVGGDLSALRTKGSARTRDDERRFEALQGFELELIELRDTLLRIAPTYRPNQDDGVQISAAPLWPLFRHKPWQKVLKDTWAKLEKGDYDWAHLALNYWPERVREKCKTDKSLAIAHGLEDLYLEPEAKPKATRGGKKNDIAGKVKIHGDIINTVPESDWDLPR